MRSSLGERDKDEEKKKPNSDWIVWTNSSVLVPHSATVPSLQASRTSWDFLQTFSSCTVSKRETRAFPDPQLFWVRPAFVETKNEKSKGVDWGWFIPLNLSKRKNGKPFALHNQLPVRGFITAEFPCRYHITLLNEIIVGLDQCHRSWHVFTQYRNVFSHMIILL